MSKHISDMIRESLERDNWESSGNTFLKRIVGFADGGSFVRDGTRIVTLRMDDAGRWFERVDGWGEVQACVDLRKHWGDPEGAIAAVLA